MNASWQIPKADERDVRRIAQLIALKLCSGDIVTLTGELGAGKTTLARALIRAIHDAPDLEVPSPTFALMQSYPEPRIAIAHLDLYRAQEPNELDELGLEDFVQDGALIVEWPEWLDNHLSANTLAISFSDTDDASVRSLKLTGTGSWIQKLERIQSIYNFLGARHDWSNARISHLQGDASTRSYARLIDGPAPALLMDSPEQSDGPIVRDGKTYSQLACLAETVRPFVAIANALHEAGVAAPELFAADLDAGLLILEDFGDQVYGTALNCGADQETLWRAATDVLLTLRADIADHTWTFPDGKHYRLPVFTTDLMHAECALLLDWYWPHVKGAPASDRVRSDFRALCAPLFERVSGSNHNWVLRDYHSPNLIWRSNEDGAARVGVIDFQDALRGPAEYDLVSLLQDARLDVPATREDTLLEHYCRRAAYLPDDFTEPFNRQDAVFRYRALGAQRNMKILGIFARLARRDDKPDYLAHVPRIWRYLARNLDHPDLYALKQWVDDHFPADVRITKTVA